MPRLYVPLTRDEFERLRRQAQEQRRRPQEQGAHLIATALRESERPQRSEKTESDRAGADR
jgi:hypothetical protein